MYSQMKLGNTLNWSQHQSTVNPNRLLKAARPQYGNKNAVRSPIHNRRDCDHEMSVKVLSSE